MQEAAKLTLLKAFISKGSGGSASGSGIESRAGTHSQGKQIIRFFLDTVPITLSGAAGWP